MSSALHLNWDCLEDSVLGLLLDFCSAKTSFLFFLDKWNDVEMCIVGEPILLSAV